MKIFQPIISGSLTQSGSAVISGSLNVLSGITGSVFGTASWAVSASYAPSSNAFPFIGNAQITGSLLLTASYISTVDYIDFNNTTSATPTDIEGRIYWDEDNGTLSLGMHGGQVVQQVGLENYFYIKNQSGTTILNGSVVRAAGTTGASGRILGNLMIADKSIAYYFTLGIATEDIINGDDGYVTTFGAVRGINTTGAGVGESWVDGDILWVSPTVLGGLTKFEPDSPNLKIQIAIVINAAANGTLFVRPDLGAFLTDLHNVNDLTTTSSFGDMLVKSGSSWISSKQLTGSYAITGSLTATSFIGSLLGNATSATTASLVNGNVNVTTATIGNTVYATAGTTIGAGTTSIYSVSNASYSSIFVDYSINEGTTNARAGTIQVISVGSEINYTETTTMDIGNTGDITWDIYLSGIDINFDIVNAAGASWRIKFSSRQM